MDETLNLEPCLEQSETRSITLLGVEMPFEEFDRLMCAQGQGKELKVVDGKVVAVDHEYTQEELNDIKSYELKQELAKIKEDIEQEIFGIIRDDYVAKKKRASEIINELRELEGKEKRETTY